MQASSLSNFAPAPSTLAASLSYRQLLLASFCVYSTASQPSARSYTPVSSLSLLFSRPHGSTETTNHVRSQFRHDANTLSPALRWPSPRFYFTTDATKPSRVKWLPVPKPQVQPITIHKLQLQPTRRKSTYGTNTEYLRAFVQYSHQRLSPKQLPQ
jgi:hypothetical protein